MDRSTGRIYVGAVNHLYDLSPEGLAIREHAITGPRADSMLCAGGTNLHIKNGLNFISKKHLTLFLN
jgi:hypothetical protein